MKKVHTGFHSIITACQIHQNENKCDETYLEKRMEEKCKEIKDDCESLFVTMLNVYRNDINTRDEKGEKIYYKNLNNLPLKINNTKYELLQIKQ